MCHAGVLGAWPPSLMTAHSPFPWTHCDPETHQIIPSFHKDSLSTNSVPGLCFALGKKINNTKLQSLRSPGPVVQTRHNHLLACTLLHWQSTSGLSIDSTLNSKPFCLMFGCKWHPLHFLHAHFVFHLPTSKISHRKPWDQS